MPALKTFAYAGLIAAGLALPSFGASAQSTLPPAAPVTAESGSTDGFDGLHVLAVSAGIIGGATVAVIATDGLIIPLYAMVTGGQASGWSLASSMAAGAGAGAGEIAVASGLAEPITRLGYYAFRSTVTLLGMVGGGFYAHSWYKGG